MTTPMTAASADSPSRSIISLSVSQSWWRRQLRCVDTYGATGRHERLGNTGRWPVAGGRWALGWALGTGCGLVGMRMGTERRRERCIPDPKNLQPDRRVDIFEFGARGLRSCRCGALGPWKGQGSGNEIDGATRWLIVPACSDLWSPLQSSSSPVLRFSGSPALQLSIIQLSTVHEAVPP